MYINIHFRMHQVREKNRLAQSKYDIIQLCK